MIELEPLGFVCQARSINAAAMQTVAVAHMAANRYISYSLKMRGICQAERLDTKILIGYQASNVNA
jgi:hypothetical protein